MHRDNRSAMIATVAPVKTYLYPGIHSVPSYISVYETAHSLLLGGVFTSLRMRPKDISHTSLVLLESVIMTTEHECLGENFFKLNFAQMKSACHVNSLDPS